MGLWEDLLKMKQHHSRHGYAPHHHGYNSSPKHGLHLILLPLLKKILMNRSLLFIGATLIIIMLVVVIGAIILIIPLVGSLITTIDQNGLKGIIETVLPVLERLWEGSGKGPGALHPFPFGAYGWSA